MGVMAYPLRYALADLALALSRAADDPAEVRSTAARAAADMIGDGAGVQLLRDDGRYDTITYHHIDDERSAAVGRVLDHAGRLPEDDFSTTLAASRRPIVLAGDGAQPLGGGERQIHAAVLCPVIVDNTYAGYLVLTRETPGAASGGGSPQGPGQYRRVGTRGPGVIRYRPGGSRRLAGTGTEPPPATPETRVAIALPSLRKSDMSR